MTTLQEKLVKTQVNQLCFNEGYTKEFVTTDDPGDPLRFRIELELGFFYVNVLIRNIAVSCSPRVSLSKS